MDSILIILKKKNNKWPKGFISPILGLFSTLKSFKNAKKKIGNFLHQGYLKSSVTGKRDQ